MMSKMVSGEKQIGQYQTFRVSIHIGKDLTKKGKSILCGMNGVIEIIVKKNQVVNMLTESQKASGRFGTRMGSYQSKETLQTVVEKVIGRIGIRMKNY